MSHFLHFWGLDLVFSSFRDTFVSGIGRRKIKKILYDKYVNILTSKDDHVDNHFSEKFVPLYHVGYFTNGDGLKLIAGYICRTFYTFMD